MRELYVIYLQFTAQKQVENLAALEQITARMFPDLDRHFVIVDNAITTAHEEQIAASVTLIAGDNRCREFTGMDCGIAWLERARNVSPDAVVLLANDTLLRDKEVADFFRLDGRQTLRWLDEQRLVGHVDCLVRPVDVFGMSVDHWVRSNFVLCTYKVLTAIAPLGLPFSDSEIFSASPEEFFRSDARLSRFFQTFLKSFLQGGVNPALWSWHSARRIVPENFEFMKLKAKAILCEFYLSAKAQRQGFGLVDISRRHIPSKEARARIRLFLYLTALWRLVPRFRRRFAA